MALVHHHNHVIEGPPVSWQQWRRLFGFDDGQEWRCESTPTGNRNPTTRKSGVIGLSSATANSSVTSRYLTLRRQTT